MAGFRYDDTDIALRYGRARELPEETLALWLEAVARDVSPASTKVIVDVGCGTGRFAKGLSERLSAFVCGVDPSHKMLGVARDTLYSPGIGFVQGVAEALPLADGAADLVYLSMVYHHLDNEFEAAAEFRRILSTTGSLCIRTSTQESMDSYLWLRFFPSAREIELPRAPSRGGLVSFLGAYGFVLARHAILRQLFGRDLGEYVEKIALRGLSSLQAIPDREFDDGVGRLREYCTAHETGEAVLEEIDLFVFRCG